MQFLMARKGIKSNNVCTSSLIKCGLVTEFIIIAFPELGTIAVLYSIKKTTQNFRLGSFKGMAFSLVLAKLLNNL